MTLIVSALADDATVQVSDRRLSFPDGSVLCDDANKGICFDCADAHVSLAYTGLALIGTTPTDHWLVDVLAANQLTSMRFPDAVEVIVERATERFLELRHLGERRRLSLVFCGFGPSGAMMALVSNSEDSSGKWLPNVSDTFSAGFWLRNQKALRKLDLKVSGTEAAVTPDLLDALERIRKRFHTKPPEERANVLVQALRRAATERSHGWSIGEECISVIVKPAGGFLATFHPRGDTALSHAPHYVTSGMSFRDIRVSSKG
jgi:hypothetical protein